MKTVERKVFYCEFCNRHRLTARAIEQHEPRCIYNPGRSACGWHGGAPSFTPPLPSEGARMLAGLAGITLDELRIWADGCPACMLAAVVQCEDLDRVALGFTYQTEVERFRGEERRQDYPW
jgi:hypothetical protein